jgi:tetratricopeptide (TPR) repeat protein
MKKKLFCIFLLFLSKGFSQTNSPKMHTTSSAIEVSKKYQNRALWFLEIPQYNRDSSTYYFDKATDVLKKNSPLQYEQLANIYLHRSDFLTCNYTLTGIDSLARIGWFYHTKTKKKERNSLLEYEFLINWAKIKLDLGEHKKALNLFSKALIIAEDFKIREFFMKDII